LQINWTVGILENNSGHLLANLWEAPIIAQGRIMEVIESLNKADIGGVIELIRAG
jgi:repressor of nif and glnA expression